MKMRGTWTVIASLLVATTPIHVEALSPPSEPEILFAKRIVELWDDRDASTVILQSRQFLQKYPSSVFKDAILGIVAEGHKHRGEYPKALRALNAIQSDEYQRKTLITRVDILQKLSREQEIVKELQPYIPELGTVPTDDESMLYTYCYTEALRVLAEKTKSTDQKKKYQNIASRRYRTLKGTTFDREAHIGLASLYRSQGKEREAANIYLSLTEKYPENRDAYLYQAAKMQMAYDPDEAFATLEETSQSELQNQSERTILKAKLLYDLEKYKTLIQMQDTLRGVITREHLSAFDYYLGMSYSKEKDYENASKVLGGIVKQNFSNLHAGETQKQILLHLATIEYHRDRPMEAQNYIDKYKQLFPNDENIVQAYLVKGIYQLKNGQAKDALNHLELVIQNYPNSKGIENIYHQKNLALMQLGEWEASRNQLIAFANEHPKNPQAFEALKKVPLCTQQMIAQAKKEGKPTESLYRQLLADLELMMNTKGVLTSQEKPSIYIEQIRCYNCCSDYKKANKLARLFLEKYPNHPEKYQVHILIAYAINELGGNRESYIDHLEKGLALKRDAPQAASVHVKLFKAYIEKLEESHDDETADVACNHLYQAFKLSQATIPEESRKWLANTFTEKLENRSIGNTYAKLFTENDLETAKKTTSLYESVDRTSQDKANLAKCYIWLGENEQALKILKETEKDADLSDSDRSICHFLKGKILESQGKDSEALVLYKGIQIGPSHVSFAAKLQAAKLAKDPKKLKQLQLQKQLKTEPVHLEAAIEYCFIQSEQTPAENREKTLLQLLKAMKADFISTDDICSQDYHAAMEGNEGRKQLYHHYMLLVDSYINIIEAKQSSSFRDRKIKNEVAKNLLETIKRNKEGLTEYLENHVTMALKRLPNK